MLKKICNILSTILLIFMLIVAGLLIVPPIMGYQSLAVLSGSMEPNIGVGAIAYVAETDPAGLEVGDVITYRISGDTFVTHRIVEIDTTAQSVITKGDANDVVDGSPVAFNQIVGRVDFHVPLLGYVSIYIKTPLGIAGACGILFVMILLTFLPEIFKSEPQENKDNEKDK